MGEMSEHDEGTNEERRKALQNTQKSNEAK